eukprot:jgi/Tetstr1/426698/TSEL_016968.t1
MAPKKNEPAKDKEDKDDATLGPPQVPETEHEPETEHTEPEPEPEPTRLDPEPEAELETPAPTTGHASGSEASGSRAPIAEAPRMVPEFLSMCTDEEVFGTEEEQRQRAAEKRKQALDITGTPGPERKTKLMTVASYDDFFDERDGSQENDSYNDFTSRSWTIHWFKNTSAEVQIYLYIELHKASLLTGKDFFDDPKGPLLACIGKIKDVELDSAGNYEALTGFASGEIDIDDLANIDKDFKNAASIQESFLSAENFSVSFPVVHKNRDCFSEEYEPLALTMANFKELVAAHEGGENPRLADSSSYKPEIDVIIEFLSAYGARQANIDGSHRREAKRMVKENYPEIYKANKGIHLTSAKMYIGLSPEVCRYMSMKLNEAGHTVVGDTSMHKLLDVGFGPHAPWLDEPSLAKQSDSADLPVGQMYLVVGLLIQGEHSVTPSLYELVDDIKHAGDNGPMAVTHTNAEWLAMIETWRNWGKYLSDHIIDWDVQDKVSDEQAAARLDAITKFRAKMGDMKSADCLTPLPVREHIAATNTTIRSEAYRIKNQMPDLVISFFTEFALLACAPELIAVSAPNVSNELWISMKAEELPVMPKGEGVDKDDKVWLNTELCKTCIVEGNFKAPATKQFVADACRQFVPERQQSSLPTRFSELVSHTWDSKDAAWGTDDFNDVFAFARQDNPHNPGA